LQTVFFEMRNDRELAAALAGIAAADIFQRQAQPPYL
jgi:hypothetical protein